jgi:hypothetical protein
MNIKAKQKKGAEANLVKISSIKGGSYTQHNTSFLIQPPPESQRMG